MNKKEENLIIFNQGVVYAAARLIEMHDQPTMAMDIIGQSGITHEDMKHCAEWDLSFLRREDESIPKGIQ
jgi:hypothetical protein